MNAASIIVVDDELGVIRLCQRLLEKAGYLVEAYSTPQIGLEAIDGKKYDLLLVDIRMPGMDGFQLIELARERLPELAVVVMTGYGTIETAIEALRRGADGLILKPFEQGSELVETVQLALESNRRKRDQVRLRALRPLLDLSESLFTQTEAERLYGLIVDAICSQLACQHAGLFAIHEGIESSQYLSSRGRDLETIGFDSFLHDTKERLPWGVSNRIDSGQAKSKSSQKFLVDHDFNSILWIPVSIGSTQLLLLAAREVGQAPFHQLETEMFALLARQSAVALDNARLYAELKGYIRRIEESQQALVRAEKMAAAGRLTASIAHEINNPLQAVQNCLYLAERDELDSEARRSYLSLAQDEMNRLIATVQRMLDFYRPGVVDRQLTELNSIVRHVLKLLDGQFKKQCVRVETDLANQSIEAFVVGDQIQQVLINLLLNGLEAMPDGGEMFIHTFSEDGNAIITVEDSGPGIPEEDRERVFEPFTSSKESGTGLGLAVSYGIMAAHGGQLTLGESRKGGASFQLLLPMGE